MCRNTYTRVRGSQRREEELEHLLKEELKCSFKRKVKNQNTSLVILDAYLGQVNLTGVGQDWLLKEERPLVLLWYFLMSHVAPCSRSLFFLPPRKPTTSLKQVKMSPIC